MGLCAAHGLYGDKVADSIPAMRPELLVDLSAQGRRTASERDMGSMSEKLHAQQCDLCPAGAEWWERAGPAAVPLPSVTATVPRVSGLGHSRHTRPSSGGTSPPE